MTNETKQTAVEQLFVEMLEIQQAGNILTFDENVELLNKYKEIEKQQMIDFAWECQEMFKHQIVEKFNETYGGNK